MKCLAFCCLLTLVGMSCSGLKKTATTEISDPNDAANLAQLFNLMIGSFDSTEQAKRDTDYYDITLHMYPIWLNKKGTAKWLYVEQAVTTMQEKPYRQRVYKVEQIDGKLFRSSIYTLPEPKDFIGAWKTPKLFDKISPDDLILRNGCHVDLKKKGDSFSGETGKKTCESSLRGASFATSIVTVSKNKIVSWDQGFDKAGKQVWGAEKGGYIFKKRYTE